MESDHWVVGMKPDDALADKEYITKEELLDRLCDAIPKSGVIRESELYFDGFTGFTPVQNKAMKLLLEYSVGITITVTAGREEYAAIQPQPWPSTDVDDSS